MHATALKWKAGVDHASRRKRAAFESLCRGDVLGQDKTELTQYAVPAAMSTSGSLFARWLIASWRNGSKESQKSLLRENEDKQAQREMEYHTLTIERSKLKA